MATQARAWRIFAMRILVIGAVCVIGARMALADDSPIIEKLRVVDVQVAPDGLFTEMAHIELQATNAAAAMQLGQQAIPFIESMQEIEITEAYTLKSDGRKLQVNPNAIYTQHPQADRQLQIVHDVRQKVIVFPDVAAGDVVAYSIKLRTKQALFPGQFLYSEFFPRSLSYQDVRETIVVPKNLPLTVEAHDIQFEKQDTGTTITYRFHYAAPKPAPDEVFAVSPLDHIPRILFSSIENYSAFGRAYADLAGPKSGVTPKIQTLADQLTRGINNKRDQAQKIYEWVSTHIRYVAIELGRNSIVPHDADNVLTNGYGDCKDHAVLFAALLKATGIDSEEVLINATNSYTLSDVPSFAQLNHMITWIPQLKLYADTTAVVAPFGTLPFTEYGKPVVHATKSGEVLRRTPLLPPGLATAATTTDEHLDASGQVTGTTTTVATGPYSQMLRSYELAIQAVGSQRAAATQLTNLNENGTGSFEASSPLELGPSYELRGRFTIQLRPDAVSGDSSFFIPPGLPVMVFAGDGLMGDYEPGKLKATEPTPCWSGHVSEKISLELPPGKTFKWIPDDDKVKTANLEFTSNWSLAGRTITVQREFTSNIDQALCTGKIRADTAKALEQINSSYRRTILLVPENEASTGETKKSGVSSAALDRERAALGEATIRAKYDDFKGVLEPIKKVVADPAFSLLNEEEQHIAYLVLGMATLNAGDKEAAFQALQHSSSMSQAIGLDWEYRFDAAYQLKNYQDAALSLTTLAKRWPKSLPDIYYEAVFNVDREVAKVPGSASYRLDMLQALYDAKWRPSDPIEIPDGLWFQLALIDLENGQTAKARSIVETIDNPFVIIQMRTDRRFDAVVRANSSRYDVAKAFDRDLADLKVLVAKYPNRLRCIHTLARFLLAANQPDKALAILNDALARALPADGSKSTFTDVDDELIWVMNYRSVTLTRLGRYDEAIEQMARSSRRPEKGVENVSQVINLAHTYNAAARPKDALATISDMTVANTSTYGAMALQEARACAYAQLHDQNNLDRVMSYIRAHTADAVLVLPNVQLCANDLDGAAKSLIDRLNDPQSRVDALFSVQDFARPSHALPFGAELQRRWNVILGRADVQGAIAKVGRIEHFSIVSPDS